MAHCPPPILPKTSERSVLAVFTPALSHPCLYPSALLTSSSSYQMGPGRVVIINRATIIINTADTITSLVLATPLPYLIDTLPLTVHHQHND